MTFLKKHWMKIVIILVIIAAIWYFTKGKKADAGTVVTPPATPATPGSTSVNPTPAS